MRVLFGAVILIIGVFFVWLGFTMEYDVNFILLGMGVILAITGYKMMKRGKKGPLQSSSSHTYSSAKENPDLTRFYTKTCRACGQKSEHELARTEGSKTAYLTCGSCGHWIETKW